MKWALTGSIGSGKSAALQCFKALDVQTLDADALCREVYEHHAALLARMFADRWSRAVLDNNGLINRGMIAQIVFSDPEELAYLNSTLHPLIESELQQKMAELPKNENLVVEVPLLYEIGWEKKFDEVVTVWAPPALVDERLRKRGMTESDIVGRRHAQLSADEKLLRADFALINSGDIAFLFAQCEQLLLM